MKKTKKLIKYCDIKNKNHYAPVEKFQFRPSVYGVLIEKGRVFLSKQWDGYDFPGGGMHIGETIDETLEREFFEETGIRVKRQKVISCENVFFITPYTKKYCNAIVMYFICKRVGGRISLKNLDQCEKEYVDTPEWIDINKLSKIKFYNSVDSVGIIKKAHKLSKS